jgi:uncharacterized protein YjiS (DUF1127 family)
MEMIMTTLSLVQALPLRGGVLAALAARYREAMARHRAFVETRRELNWLSDRELADLGMMRCDIDRIAREAASRV